LEGGNAIVQLRAKLLAGKTQEHLVSAGEFSGQLHAQAVDAFIAIREAACSEGIDLCIASSFRSFDRQLLIWNSKARGERPIQNEQGDVIDIAQLAETELMHAILRWSALPGASRHHWGTDMDVYDGLALEEGASPGLLASEYQPGGPFRKLNDWLEANISKFGFCRPYQQDNGGIAPEPWHLSYQPVASELESQLNLPYLTELLVDSELELKETVLQHLEEIFERYIQIT
jgi:LAS superfamily LD-carboxypeptidase LdcB